MKEYLIILAGGLSQDKNGRWHTTLGEEEAGKTGLLLNDKLRVVAGASLWQANKDLMIIASGGKGSLKNVLPKDLTLSRVIKDELIELGVSTQNIIEENKTSTTYEQLVAVGEMIRTRKINGTISIISNNYHLPRIKAMIDFTALKEFLSNVNLIGAEDILLRLVPTEWGAFIEGSNNTEAMKKRLENEAKGIEQIKNGTYDLR